MTAVLDHRFFGDIQPQSGTPLSLGGVEEIEQVLYLILRNPLTVVFDPENHMIVLSGHDEIDPVAGRMRILP